MDLRPRLQTIAGFIRSDDRILDIGTDHARLPVYLIERALCAEATGTELSAGPLERARRTVRLHGLEDKIPLLLRDGAEGLDSCSYDTVIISGMGADTIVEIVRRNSWLMKKRLITQPQTRVALFADMMGKEGFSLLHHVIATEGRRQYHIFVFEGEHL